MNPTGTRHVCTRATRSSGRGLAGRTRGFTLVELMVTIAVAIVLTAIAVPSFQNIVASSRLTGTANSFVDALNVARMEAIKLNAKAQFCSNSSNGDGTLGTACAGQTGAVYVLTDSANGTVATQVHASTVPPHSNLKLVAVTALQFSPQGLAYKLNSTTPFSGTVAKICAPGSNSYRTITMTTGTIIKTTKSHGSC